jgi:hemolysin III
MRLKQRYLFWDEIAPGGTFKNRRNDQVLNFTGKMTKMKKEPRYTRQEELANAYSHLAGMLLSIAGTVMMIYLSALHGGLLHRISTAVFGSTMVLLYFSSTMTHILPEGRAKDSFFNMDRIAIYLLIAGTYTPFALVTLGGTLGWIIFGLEWGMAIVGIVMILVKPGDFQNGVNMFFVGSYAVMGWLVLAVIVPVVRSMPVLGWLLILIGGLWYTVGIAFYKAGRFPYHHLVWHLLVIAGSVSHFFAVFLYVIPR